MGIINPNQGVIAAESVVTAMLANLAVTEPKIGNKAVGAEKVGTGTIPVPGAEKAIVFGGGAVARTLLVAFTGDGALTTVKIKHSIPKQGVMAVAFKSAAKLPTEAPATALGKWVNENETEGTYTFTAAPAAKEEVFILVFG